VTAGKGSSTGLASRPLVDQGHPCGVKRALFLLALTGCGGDIDEPWQLAHDRIIAVRAEPPGILPGQQTRIALLTGFEELPVAVRAPDVGYVVSPGSMTDVMSFTGDGWVVTAPTEARLADARAELGLSPGAPVPLVIGVAAAWPYPVMSPNEAGFGALKTVWLGEQRTNPDLSSATIDGAEAPADGTEIVLSKLAKPPLSVQADEEHGSVNWLTSAGVMHDFDLANAYLTFDDEEQPDAGELVLVVRDALGGVSWRIWPLRAE
jgi:hypothetical protein